MAIDDNTPYEGSHRANPRPSTRVDRDNSVNLSQSFDVFTSEMRALNRTMKAMRKDIQATLDMQSKYSSNPRSSRAYREARDKVRADHPSETYDPLLGVIQEAMANQNWNEYNRRMRNPRPSNQSSGPSFNYYVNPRERIPNFTMASQSLTHFQSWAAQRIGEGIAGNRDVYHPSLQGTPAPPDPQAGQYKGRHRVDPSRRSQTPQQSPTANPTAGQPSSTPAPQENEEGIQTGDVTGAATVAGAAMRTRIGSVVAQSGGTAAGLGAAVKRLPGIGLTITGVVKGTEIYQEQREQARGYQEMTGTSGAEGWWTKREEDLYRWTNPFRFSGERAREQFQTVTALGYNDLGSDSSIRQGSRAEALRFMDQAYHNVGMDTDESGRVLESASRNTQTNINDLVQALQRLSQSAGEAGVNAMKARENFIQMFEGVTQRGYGASALPIAEMLTNTQLAYGKTFENTDLSGILGQGQVAMVAAQTGQTYGQTQGMLRNNPEQFLMASSGNFTEHLQNINPDFASAVQDAAAGEDLSSEATRNRIKDELVGPGGQFANEDFETQAQAMSELTGIPMNREQFIDAAIAEMGGGGMAQQAAEQEELRSSQQAGSIAEVLQRGGSPLMDKALDATVSDTTLGLGGTPLNELSREEQAAFIERGAADYAAYQSGDRFTLSDDAQGYAQYRQNLVDQLNEIDGTASGPSGAVQQYNEKWLEKGKQDPFIESLLMNLGESQGNAKVEVELAGGGTRVVSLEEAMQHYGDALASGKVRFVNEELAGKTTEDVAGMQGTGEYEPVGDENTTNEKLDELGVGVSGEEWRSENPNAGGGGEQRVTIELSPDAERLFRVVESDPNAAANYGSPTDMGDSDLSRYPSQQPN